jgi:hypothetical protein
MRDFRVAKLGRETPILTIDPKKPEAFGPSSKFFSRLSEPVVPKASLRVHFLRNDLPTPYVSK